jgi:hypothetical protein
MIKNILMTTLLSCFVINNCICENLEDESLGYKETRCLYLECEYGLMELGQCICSCAPCTLDNDKCECYTQANEQEVCSDLCNVSDAGQPDYGAHSCLSYCLSGEYKQECEGVLACCQAVCQ